MGCGWLCEDSFRHCWYQYGCNGVACAWQRLSTAFNRESEQTMGFDSRPARVNELVDTQWSSCCCLPWACLQNRIINGVTEWRVHWRMSILGRNLNWQLLKCLYMKCHSSLCVTLLNEWVNNGWRFSAAVRNACESLEKHCVVMHAAAATGSEVTKEQKNNVVRAWWEWLWASRRRKPQSRGSDVKSRSLMRQSLSCSWPSQYAEVRLTMIVLQGLRCLLSHWCRSSLFCKESWVAAVPPVTQCDRFLCQNVARPNVKFLWFWLRLQ